MAGAIAGAYYGVGEIPAELARACEGAEDARKQAGQLFAKAEARMTEGKTSE